MPILLLLFIILFCFLFDWLHFEGISSQQEVDEYASQCSGSEVQLTCINNTLHNNNVTNGVIWWARTIDKFPVQVLVQYELDSKELLYKADSNKYQFNVSDYSLTIKNTHPRDGLYHYECRTSSGYSRKMTINIGEESFICFCHE